MIRTRGFTLVELMVVLLIVAILAAVAIPSYRQYVLRSHRTDAQRALMDVAARQERYYYSNNAYTSSLSALGSSASAAAPYYQLSIPSASSTDYTLRATPIGSQGDDKCGYLELNRAGQKSEQNTSASKCWGT